MGSATSYEGSTHMHTCEWRRALKSCDDQGLEPLPGAKQPLAWRPVRRYYVLPAPRDPARVPTSRSHSLHQ